VIALAYSLATGGAAIRLFCTVHGGRLCNFGIADRNCFGPK
jgi:hypothetical protein